MSQSTFKPATDALYFRLRSVLAQISNNRVTHVVGIILKHIFRWRTFFFILAILNIKSLPFSWHLRLFYEMLHHSSRPSDIRKRLRKAAAALPPPSAISPSRPKPVHPIFRPVTTRTHVPLYESDYNGHKSNSTYFSDLDLSRGALVASLINPALQLNTLVPYGVRKGLCYPILGSVHTSFLREIKPYERYAVRSRVLGWDRKWIIIGSVFTRPATRDEVLQDRSSGKGFLKHFGGGGSDVQEVVFAVVLNKYVIKSGRMTVPPELCFASSGWFPVRPEATATIRRYNKSSTGPDTNAGNNSGLASAVETATGTGTATPSALGPGKTAEDATNMVHRVAMEAGRRLSIASAEPQRPKLTTLTDDEEEDEMIGWSWDEIETERLNGLKVAEAWLGLDVELRRQYESEIARKIWD